MRTRLSKSNKYILNIIFILFTIYFINNSIANVSQKLIFKYSVPDGIEKLVISTEKTELISEWISPEILNYEMKKENWQHLSRSTAQKKLAGIDGKMIVDIVRNGKITLTREFWSSDDNNEIAIRQKITNHNEKPIQLKTLIPFKLNGSRGLNFKNEKRADRWNVLIQERLKNGKPRSIVPSDKEPLEIDPFCVFHANKENTPDLLIGYLSQMGHLAQLILQFKKSGNKVDFSSLAAECLFDGCLIPQGGERTSQWLYLRAGFNPNQIIADYADRVGVYHGVKEPPKPAPSVFCTWYFHGRKYNEKLFMEDIQSLEENRMVFDVFLIDDCWANGNWGYWTPNNVFPNGMKFVTDQMKRLGYRPGIWTAPYSVEKNAAIVKEHPEWLIKTDADSLVEFGYATKAWILDPTYPGVCDHLENVYRRLANDYGFSYFKFDFMRSVFIYDNAKFYNPHATRLEAYRMGLEAIRRGVGPDSYISVCGGHYGGSLGIANSQRSGSDVVSIWIPKQINCFRQNILRTWMSRLWHVDPDALMIRRREKPFHLPEDRHSKLALGKLTDPEAITFALNQYVSGGLNCFTEYLNELDPDRRMLYRHVIPSISKSSVPLDIFNTFCPSMMLTEVEPVCKDLEPWNTISITNWEDTDKEIQIILSDEIVGVLKSTQFIVSEFVTQDVLGIYSKNEKIDLGSILPHQSRVLRVAPWNGITPVLTGTDLHFSGGGIEIKEWKVSHDRIKGKIQTDWYYPVNVSVAFPSDNQNNYLLETITIQPGQRVFYIEL
jgi:alpha-galactosidase